MGKFDWKYAHAATSQHGDMVCTACGRRIVEGEYRYRTTSNAHLPQHRACSQNDPEWSERDAAVEKNNKWMRERKQAFDDFVDRWGLPDDLCEDYIENWEGE